MPLTGKRVLITGGAVRVGAALTRAFAAAGAQVAIHCFRSVAAAEALQTELPGDGHRIVVADLARPDAAERIFAELDAPVDLLINNASRYGADRRIASADAAEERALFQVNYHTPLALIRRFAAQETIADGAVVNLLDQEIGKAAPGGGAYIQSRCALRDATLELARELAPRIRVCAVAPGPVLPPVWAPESRMERVLREVPMGRPVALDDLCSAVLFLISNRSVTGEILYVDGGQHLT